MTCGTPASTEPMAATCRSSATRPAFRSRSCDVEPGSTHDLTAARVTGFLGALHAAAALLGRPSLADKGYDGAGAGIHTPRARAKSALRGLTCGDGGQRPRSSVLSRRCAVTCRVSTW